MRTFISLLLFLTTTLLQAETVYHLVRVSEIESGSLYVFEQEGRVMNNVISNGALATTDDYKLKDLCGNESYVWKVEASSKMFRMRNMAIATDKCYLSTVKNSSNLEFASKSASGILWDFQYISVGTYWLITNPNMSDRMLAYMSSSDPRYKSYNSRSDIYPHHIKIYKLVEDSGEGITPVFTPQPEKGARSYDLSGRIIRTPSHSISISGGKKIIIMKKNH